MASSERGSPWSFSSTAVFSCPKRVRPKTRDSDTHTARTGNLRVLTAVPAADCPAHQHVFASLLGIVHSSTHRQGLDFFFSFFFFFSPGPRRGLSRCSNLDKQTLWSPLP